MARHRSPVAWLEDLSFELLTRSFPRDSLLKALGHPFSYAVPPAAVGAEVRATLSHEADDARRTRRSFQVALGGLARGPQVTIWSTCDCGAWGPQCAHGLALLADLAASPELRRAIMEGRPTAALLDALSPQRAALSHDWAAVALGARWLPSSQVARVADPDIVLTVIEGTRTAPTPGYGIVQPSLEVRLQNRDDRTLLDPYQFLAGALRAPYRRVVALGTPLSRGRKGVQIVGAQASMALELLRVGGLPARLEKSHQHVRFGPSPLALAITRTTLPPERVGLTQASLEATSEPFGWVPRAAPRGRHEPRREPAPVDALEGRWTSADGAVDLPAREAVFFSGPYPFVWDPARATFHPVDSSVDPDLAWNVHLTPSVEIPPGGAAGLYRVLRRSLRGRAVRLPPPEALGLPAQERPGLVVRIDGAPLDVRVHVEAEYGHGTLALAPTGDADEPSPGRDLDAESAALARVAASDVAFDPGAGCFRAEGDAAVAFWTHGLPKLRAEGDPPVAVFLSDRLQHVTVRPPLRSRVRISLVGSLLDADVSLGSEAQAADLAAVREALRRKRRWVALDDGSLAEITDAVADLVEDLEPVLPDGHGRLAAHQLGRVEHWLDVSERPEVDPAVEALRAKLRALAVAAEPAMPKGLQATLRPYQRRGLAWLQFLDALGAGGILADDMGLGKTVTALALLQWRRERDGQAPSLVVCPTSVAPNWAREAERFAPELRVLVLHGAGRERRPERLREADLVVTTYALLRLDVELLAGVAFRYVVLDEAQNIKNVGALTTQAAKRLVTEGRLALTGTPVENRLGELWSLMEFANPGMLGSQRDFENRFERPIAADPAGIEARRLRALARPFVLRRTKSEVLSDLPPKEEVDLACAPTARQKKLYDALAAVLREDVRAKVEKVGLGRSGITVLTALLRLRQMACDPRLIEPRAPEAASAKREVFLDLVRELVAEGRRALVFSQFVELLGLWRKDLEREGIRYEYLDGATRDREAVVTRFQHGDAPLFLISLRAGGTGLNLTAADTVIHCDPWWNPAVEDQATDRAHRIGQDRPVTVYRLVARGTVEEKIVTLKARKRALADAVIHADAGALKGLSDDDVRALLGDADPLDDDAPDDVSDDAPDDAGAPDEPAPKPAPKRPRRKAPPTSPR